VLTNYIAAALKRANYEILEDDSCYYGEIPGFQGVYATANNLEDCRHELEEILEEWIFLRIYEHLELPTVDGISLKVIKDVAA
jgi:predicted RNase H-like HicB family nuclease